MSSLFCGSSLPLFQALTRQHVATVTAFVTVGFSLDGVEIDPELTRTYRGTVSLRFKPGKRSRVAVKIVDDRGIECLKVVEVE